MGEYRNYRNNEKKEANQKLYGMTVGYHFRNNGKMIALMSLAPIPYKIFKWVMPIYAIFHFLTGIANSELGLNTLIFEGIIYVAVVVTKFILCEKWLDEYNRDNGTDYEYQQML